MARARVIVIAISSFRPFSKCSEEIASNQKQAFRSWLTAFERIVYFGSPCLEMASCLTEFAGADSKPSIASMARLASGFCGWSCIVNADIIIDGSKLKEVQWKLHNRRCVCALSRRWCIKEKMIIDAGLDWFAATDKVWAHVARVIPESFCLGRIMFDTWLASFFSTEYRTKCADCSQAKFVHHPPHGDRTDQNFDAPTKDPYLNQMAWPAISIL